MAVTIQDIWQSGRFVTGIAATPADVQSGKALFCIEPGGQPVDIQIPQYAWHTDQETKNRTLHIVIQAERANNGQHLVGAINIETGEELVGFDFEFELVGSTCPV